MNKPELDIKRDTKTSVVLVDTGDWEQTRGSLRHHLDEVLPAMEAKELRNDAVAFLIDYLWQAEYEIGGEKLRLETVELDCIRVTAESEQLLEKFLAKLRESLEAFGVRVYETTYGKIH